MLLRSTFNAVVVDGLVRGAEEAARVEVAYAKSFYAGAAHGGNAFALRTVTTSTNTGVLITNNDNTVMTRSDRWYCRIAPHAPTTTPMTVPMTASEMSRVSMATSQGPAKALMIGSKE